MRSDTLEQAIDLGIGFQQLKDAIGGDDQIEGTAQGKLGDITEFHLRFGRGYRCRLHLLLAMGEHGLGPINAVDKAAHCRQWEQHTTGTAAQFQDRGICRGEACLIEGEIIRDCRIHIVVLCRLGSNILTHLCLSRDLPL
jgi:hypothetical protein